MSKKFSHQLVRRQRISTPMFMAKVLTSFKKVFKLHKSKNVLLIIVMVVNQMLTYVFYPNFGNPRF